MGPGSRVVVAALLAAVVMGYDPRAKPGQAPFRRMTPTKPGEPDWAENPMLLAEAAGLGSADLARIDVRGTPI